MKRFSLMFVIALIFSTNLFAAEKHPFGFDDMIKMHRISEPKVSPDGKWIVFTAGLPNLKANKVEKNLWIVGSDGQGLRQLTDSSTSPNYGTVWFKNSQEFLFVSVDKGSGQIWKMNPFTKKKAQITKFPIDVDNVKLSPDENWILFSAEVFPDCSDFECTVKKDKEIEDNPVKAKIYDDLLFRHWDTWASGKRNHLFIMPVAGGAAIDLTQGINEDAPTKPFGGGEEVAFSPDSKEIAYTIKLAKDPAIHTNLDVYTIDLDTKKQKCITCDNLATDTQPSYSPDGKWLAYLAMKRPGFESDKYDIILMDRKTGNKKSITENWDYSSSAINWSADSKKIYTTAENKGNKSIYLIDIVSGQPKTLVEKHFNDNLDLGNDQFVFTQDSITRPAEIFISKLDGSDLKQVTTMNKAVMDEVLTNEPEEFWFKGAKGESVQGWFIKPVGFKEGEKYPLAYYIHGGPQGSFGDHFHYRWNVELGAGEGFAVAAVNFHGSTGFGQKFTDSISKNWGSLPYEDLMKGLDSVLATHPWIDSKRMCALGASYGGYMVNYIQGKTDRFACLVTHDGEFSNYSAYFNTEELWFPEWEFGGLPWENPKGYTQYSPDQFVKNWKTPMLVIHGAKDYRLVDTEGMSTFTALRRKGIPARFIYFPNENHWVLKPLNSKLWHKEVFDWMKKWTTAK